MVEDIVTWYPAGTAPAATIRFVVWPVWPTAVVWHAHVLPTAMGNGIELACTNESELALGRALGAELGGAPGAEPDRAPAAERVLGCALVADLVVVGALVTGAALEAREFAPAKVLPDDWGMSGAVPAGPPMHPARTMTARPARTALTDPCFLMQMPRSAGVMSAAQIPVWTHQK